MRLSRLAAVAVLALALAAPAAPAQAGSTQPSPLAPLITGKLLDPLIGLLGPLPAKHVPYTGSICPGGEPQCIEDVLSTMRQRLAPLAASCDHDALFALAYLRVTENVKAATDAGFFTDRKWLTQIDAVFAQMYFDTFDDYRAGRTVPKAWKIALDASRGKAMSGLGSFLIGMNAHINNDFPHVIATVGLTGADGKSHKPDHNAYNQRLDAMYVPVFQEISERFDPHFTDVQELGDLDDLGVSLVMRGWREMVWRHAEMLVAARTAAAKRAVSAEIEEYAATQARLIRAIFASPSSATRDAFCATHHG